MGREGQKAFGSAMEASEEDGEDGEENIYPKGGE